jgi:hypothetical protein
MLRADSNGMLLFVMNLSPADLVRDGRGCESWGQVLLREKGPA